MLAHILCIHIPGAPEFQLRLALAGAYKPGYKQAGLGYLRKLGRLARDLENEHYLNLLRSMLASAHYTSTTYHNPTFAFRFKHSSKMPWIKSLFNTPVKAEPQLAPTDAWV